MESRCGFQRDAKPLIGASGVAGCCSVLPSTLSTLTEQWLFAHNAQALRLGRIVEADIKARKDDICCCFVEFLDRRKMDGVVGAKSMYASESCGPDRDGAAH